MRPRRKTDGTPFERWGGQPFFDALVEQFYVGVTTDPLLRPMYPEDLDESKTHLALFLGQYWGGPDTYNQVRGHPRLRMRHAPFVIGRAEAEASIIDCSDAVLASVDAMGMAPDDRTELLDYLSMAARNLQNAH